MKTLLSISALITTLLFSSCGSNMDVVEPDCTTANTVMENFYSNLINGSNAYIDDVWMDLDTHEYTFSIAQSGTICSVGYQAQNGYAGQYGIEIQEVGGNLLYSGNHTFSGASTDFQLITPIAITAGQDYVIRRTVLTPASINDQLGRGMRVNGGGSVQFPLTVGNLTISASNFYGSGGPVPNIAVPYIAFGFN